MADRTAVIIGARGGIGAALADALDLGSSYANVIRLHRESDLPVDILDEASIATAAASLADTQPPVQLAIVATGLLHSAGKGPEKSLRELEPDWMMQNSSTPSGLRLWPNIFCR